MIQLVHFFPKHRISWLMWVAIGVFVVGVLLRFAYVWEVGHHPFLNLSLPKSDLFTHDLMARNAIHLQPLEMSASIYPITVSYIALIYRFLGVESFPVYVVNFLLSMMGIAMIIIIGKTMFGWRSGIFAGMGMMFYRMNFLYDGLKDGTALSQFLLIAMIFTFVMFIKKERQGFYIWFFIFALLACSIRIFYWLLIIPAVVFCVVRFRQWKSALMITVNIFFIALGILSFFHFRGADAFGHKFAIHFYIGNHAGTRGLLHDIPGISTNAEGFSKGAILKAYDESGSTEGLDFYWVKKTFQSYQNHYADWVKLIAKKLLYLTNNFEPHNLASIYYYEKYTWLKYFPRLNFAVVFSLGMAGMILVFVKRHRAGMALVLPVIFLTVMILSVFITARYRMPLIPFFCLYAGFSADQLFCFIRNKKYLWMTGVLLFLISTIVWAKRPIPFFRKERDIAFWESEAKRAEQYYARVAELRQKFFEWDKLNYYEKIFLTIYMEQHTMPYEFLEAYEVLFPLTANDVGARNALLRQRAQLEESMFNFQKARVIWEQLKDDPEWEAQAEEKLREIKIVGPLLDKKFLKE